MTDTDILTQFFNVVFPGVPQEDIFCCSFRNHHPGAADPWPYTPLRNLFKHNPDVVKSEEYFCTSTIAGIVFTQAGNPSRSTANFRALHVVVLDDTDPTDASLPTPTYVVETSPDNYQIGYVLEEPIDDPDLAAAVIHSIYEELVIPHDAGGKMAMKVVRPPWGWNLKNKPGCPFKVSLTEWNPDQRYTWQALLDAFVVTLKEVTAAKPKSKTVVVGDGPQLKESEYRDWVLEAMNKKGLVLEDQGDFVTVTCPWGGTHTGDDTTSRYLPCGRGDLPNQRGWKCFHDHCVGKSTRDFLFWLKEHHQIHTKQDATDEMLVQRYCHIQNGDLVGDMRARAGSTLKLSRLSWFKNAWAMPVWIPGEKGRPKSAGIRWENSRDRIKVEDAGYAPEEDRLYERDGKTYYNLYFPPQHPDPTGEPTWFLDHVAHVVPDYEERELFLDWLAFKVQNPGKRSYAVLMTTETYGIGRSAIGDAMRAVLEDGVQTLTLEDLLGKGSQGQYNDWAAKNQLVVIDEAREEVGGYRDDTKSYEQLKRLIDIRVMKGERIKVKYGPIIHADVVCNFLICTNHYDALRIPEGDRRFYVIRNAETRREDYTDLWEAIERPQDVANLYHWFMAREIRADLKYPPMTRGKRHMIEVNKTWPEEMAEWVLETLPGDLVKEKQYLAACDRWGQEHMDDATQGKVSSMGRKYFRKLRYILDDPDLSRIGDNRVRVRVLRNHEHWNSIRNNSDFTAQALEAIDKNGKADLFPFPTGVNKPPK